MVDHINEEVLRDRIKKEFMNKEGQIGVNETDVLFNILADINSEKRIFISIPGELVNLAYNIFYIKLFDSVMNTPISNYKNIISKVNESIKTADMLIKKIQESREEIKNNSLRKCFYGIMGNTRVIRAAAYKIRRNTLDYVINTLGEKAGIPKLDEKMSENEVTCKLIRPTKSKGSSRFKRAEHIIITNAHNIIIKDQDEIVGPNADSSEELWISEDDICSLQLYIRENNVRTNEPIGLNTLVDMLIYDISTYEETAYIYNELHIALFNIFTNKDLNSQVDELYTKEEYSNKIKEALNGIKNKKSTDSVSEEKAAESLIESIDSSDDFYDKLFGLPTVGRRTARPIGPITNRPLTINTPTTSIHRMKLETIAKIWNESLVKDMPKDNSKSDDTNDAVSDNNKLEDTIDAVSDNSKSDDTSKSISETSESEDTNDAVSENSEPESEKVDKHSLKTTSEDKTLDELVPESRNEQKPNEKEVIHFWSTKIFKIVAVISVAVYIIIFNIFIIYPTEAK
ncbi:hypothetical protein NEIRO03_1909 [Nematocida sp. AWRm78]|nr:hypothetical protein NEIRO02_1925 [Nematocida sp. AWRm79]KAI5185027.1 hypothetical protein NEIRO03_1909 [Nematocida sp. AWRm78]